MPLLVRHDSNNKTFALFHLELNLANMMIDPEIEIDNARHEILSNGYSITEMQMMDNLDQFIRTVYFYCKQTN